MPTWTYNNASIWRSCVTSSRNVLTLRTRPSRFMSGKTRKLETVGDWRRVILVRRISHESADQRELAHPKRFRLFFLCGHVFGGHLFSIFQRNSVTPVGRQCFSVRGGVCLVCRSRPSRIRTVVRVSLNYHRDIFMSNEIVRPYHFPHLY